MSDHLPTVISPNASKLPTITSEELMHLNDARGLFSQGFYPYALLAVWNAAVVNLRRRVEAYGVDLFNSVIKDEPGKKKYKKDGETLAERWEGVDEHVLITGATKLGLLNPKAGKSLEMINWMRNHASPAHHSDHSVDKADVIAHSLILEKNLFDQPLPVPGHSVADLFEPIKKSVLINDQIEVLVDQIRSLKQQDLRNVFGFMLNLLCSGEPPAVNNVMVLFPEVWERASEELRQTVGFKYHSLTLETDNDGTNNKSAAQRIFDFLLEVNGIKYIPDALRAKIYRKFARDLASAKDTRYGWQQEVAAAKALSQLGPHVPTVAFEEVYQEIVAVWCGNYWGRSDAYLTLEDFVFIPSPDHLIAVAGLFQKNNRAQEELFQNEPKKQAAALLEEIKNRLTSIKDKNTIDEIIKTVNDL